MAGRTILAFDTSAAHCAAAVVRGEAITGTFFEEMARGQSERLVPILEELLSAEGIGWRDLDALAVGVGPGNFTGIRISVATARGLALGLGIPAVGLSTFELLRDPDDPVSGIVSVEAPRGRAYLQAFEDGIARGQPVMADLAAVPADLAASGHVMGHEAARIGQTLGIPHEERSFGDIPRRLGSAALRKWHEGIDAAARPAPLYVRAADAAPPADPPPVILP